MGLWPGGFWASLGGLLGLLLASWGPLGRVLKPLGRVLGRLGPSLEAPEDLLGLLGFEVILH